MEQVKHSHSLERLTATLRAAVTQFKRQGTAPCSSSEQTQQRR